MAQPRAALADLLRPEFKPGHGFNRAGFTERWNALLDAAGVPRDGEAATVPVSPSPAPQTPPAAPTAIFRTGLTSPPEFFKALRTTGLFKTLTEAQVQGINHKLLAFGAAGWVISYAAYGFATSYWETGRKMQPCREKGSGDGPDADPWDDYLERYDTGRLAIRLGNTPEADGDGVATAGKGDVQLTGVANYRRATVELRKRGIIGPDVDLVKTPELVLRSDISAAIMVAGMEEGWFTGRKLAHTLPSNRPATLAEFIASRLIINGRDKDDEIGAIAIDWQTALKAGGWA